jgi:hypothetical protein
MAIVIDIDCLRGKDNEYVVKELALVGCDFQQTYHFWAPYSSRLLPDSIRHQNHWIRANINGYHWQDGCIPYTQLEPILQQFNDSVEILTKGSEKVTFLQQYAPVVHDLNDRVPVPPQHPYIYNNDDRRCAHHHRNNNNKQCATLKARKYFWWYERTRTASSPE